MSDLKINQRQIEEVKQQTKVPGLALDIDETLSDTTAFYFDHMQKQFGKLEDLSTRELIKKYRYSYRVPQWQHEEAKQFHDELRHDDSVQEDFELLENCNEAVNKVNQLIPIVAYVTTRPEAVVNGTRRWLAKHNFPDKPIIARPAGLTYEQVNTWKARVLELLYPEVLGIIDDEPDMGGNLDKNYKGVIFYYNAPKHIEAKVRVYPSKTWEDIYQNVKHFTETKTNAAH